MLASDCFFRAAFHLLIARLSRNGLYELAMSGDRFQFSVRKHRGATLIEVLVSVVVSSVGLLGLAGLMATTARVNQSAFQRTQVGLAAQALIESMHVNPVAVAQGRYNRAGSSVMAASVDCRKQACSVSARADYDVAQFHSELENTLPGAQTSLKCDPPASPAIAANIYDGVCRMEIDWSERALTKGGDPVPQSLAWVFRP
jgi:type IV pilus assembly protein PilV